MRSRGIITLAVGKPRHIEMAKSLARSLILHDPTLMRAIITDSTDPELGDLFTYRIDLRPEYGSEPRQRMHLDLYTPFDETLFIASNSLAVRSLDSFWTAFHTVPFGVCGPHILTTGRVDDALDLPFLLNHFRLATLPAPPEFSGGLYYFKRSPEAAALFATARDLLHHASELHFRHDDFEDTLTADPSDQTLYSVALAIHNLTVTDMGPGGMWPAIDATICLAFDIPHSICTFVKPGRLFLPDILHLAHFTESLFYLRECSRLKHLLNGHPDLTLPQELELISTAASLWARRKARFLHQRLQPLLPTFPTPTTQHAAKQRKPSPTLTIATQP